MHALVVCFHDAGHQQRLSQIESGKRLELNHIKQLSLMYDF